MYIYIYFLGTRTIYIYFIHIFILGKALWDEGASEGWNFLENLCIGFFGREI